MEEWSRGNWTNGCVRKRPLLCERINQTDEVAKEDGFLKLEMMKVPCFVERLPIPVGDCREYCLNNCSCIVYAYDAGIGCMTWTGSLIDIQKLFPIGGPDLYIRLARSELEKKDNKVVVIVPVAAGITTCAICTFFLWRWMAKHKALKDKSRALLLDRNDNLDEVELQDLPLFNFEKLATATNNFHLTNKLGQGGFGQVYKVFDGTGDNIDDFDDADDIRDDFDGSCTTPATPPTVPFNHASNSSLQSWFEMVNLKRLLKASKADWNNGTITRHNHIEILQMYADPEITLTDQETAQWYYDGLQNVDDLYPAPGSLDNMPDEYEDGRSTTPPQSRPTNAAGPSGAATPTPTTGVADIPTPPRRRFRAGTIGGGLDHAAPRSQHANTVREDRLEIVLDELRDSNRCREEEHAELMRIFRSYRHNDDQSHTPLGHSLSMSQYARSYHPFDPPVGLQNSAEVQDPPVVPQNSAEVQDPPVGQQNSAEVQDPPAGQQNSAEVQDPPVGIQNSPNVQDPPLMAQQTSKVLFISVNYV
ncbi:hypothetical protein Q3G72_004886 [Acer saccharum]|nr:hypothetical protein Q3G72_004886 [Acer saccharum]